MINNSVNQNNLISLEMDNQNEPKAIDCSEIDFNKLNLNQFQSLEKDISERNKIVKGLKPRKQRDTKSFVVMKIHGRAYQVKAVDVERYNALKSEKAKENMEFHRKVQTAVLG